MAIAVWAAGFSAGAALGPVVGGLLLEHFAWGSVFLLAVPVLVPLLILVPLLVPESRDPNPGRFDPLSVVLSLATMVPIVYAIKEFAVHGTESPPPLVLHRGRCSAFGVLFVRRQNRLETPMLDMALFRRWSFTGSVLVNLLSVIGLVGFLYFVAQHLQLIARALARWRRASRSFPASSMMIVAGIGVVPIAKRVAPAHRRAGGAGLLDRSATCSSRSPRAAGRCRLLIVAFVLARRRHRRGRDGLERADPRERAAGEGGRGQRRLRDGVRARRGARHDDHGRHPRRVLPREPRAAGGLPTDGGGRRARDARRRRRRSRRARPGSLGAALRDAAAHAFDAGVGVTALIGAALIVIAAVIAALTLGGRPKPSAPSTERIRVTGPTLRSAPPAVRWRAGARRRIHGVR